MGISKLCVIPLMKQKRHSLDMWVPATVHAGLACDLFWKTTSAHSPGDASEIFDEAVERLQSSVSWIPNKQPTIDVWNTEVKQEALVDVLNHIALDNVRNPMAAIIQMMTQMRRQIQ